MNHADWIRNVVDHPSASTATIAGQWHNIQLRPDMGAGDMLNVGVAFVDASHHVHLRMAHDLSRLTCLYDDAIDVASFEHLCSVVESAFNGVPVNSFHLSNLSPNAFMSDGRYASGESIEEILARLFEATVPVGRPRESDRQPRTRAKSLSTEQVTKLVIDRLVERMGQRAIPFISGGLWTVHDRSGAERKIRLPIRRAGRICASVASVCTKDEYRRRFQLAKAGLDLDTVREHSGHERLGLLVLRPMTSDGYTESELQSIDNEIDDTAWQLRSVANIDVEASDDVDHLSETLQEWIEEAA